MENTLLKPLGKARNIVEALKLDITYVYDDLMFVEHSAFILRFDKEDATKIYLHFNVECDTDEAKNIESDLINAAKQEGLNILKDKSFKMSPNEETSEIDLTFEK